MLIKIILFIFERIGFVLLILNLFEEMVEEIFMLFMVVMVINIIIFVGSGFKICCLVCIWFMM